MGATVALWASAALTAYSIVEQQDASKRQASAESRRQQLLSENIFALGQQAGQAAQESIWAKEEGTTAAAWGAVSKDVFTTAGGYKELWASGKRIFS